MCGYRNVHTLKKLWGLLVTEMNLFCSRSERRDAYGLVPESREYGNEERNFRSERESGGFVDAPPDALLRSLQSLAASGALENDAVLQEYVRKFSGEINYVLTSHSSSVKN